MKTINEVDLNEEIKRFRSQRFIAMPIAGLVMWLITGILGFVLEPKMAALSIFITTGMIVYLGMFVSKFTGEHFIGKKKQKNVFDALFMFTVAQALLAYAIAIPFYMQDFTSLPMSVGILTGMMWLSMSWMLGHWIGIAHGVSRTIIVLVVWYLMPDHRFTMIPFAIVAVYLVTIVVLEKRWRNHRRNPTHTPH